MNLNEIPDWTPVRSSNIEALAYHAGRLVVQFRHGSVYSYQNVPYRLFRELTRAESAGRDFIRLVRNHPSEYPFTLEHGA